MQGFSTAFRSGGGFGQRALPTGRLISEVLRLADVHEDLGGGRTRLRLSPRRLKQPEVRAVLGPDAGLAATLSVIFDEREAQIVQVSNDAPELDLEDRLIAEYEDNAYAAARKRRQPIRRPAGGWGMAA
jgi:hypothetical protein